jgi:hypothetical protein
MIWPLKLSVLATHETVGDGSITGEALADAIGGEPPIASEASAAA